MELDTAVRVAMESPAAPLGFAMVVGNDAAWNAELQIQLREYGADRTLGCELLPTRCDAVATAVGAFGEHITSPLDSTLAALSIYCNCWLPRTS